MISPRYRYFRFTTRLTTKLQTQKFKECTQVSHKRRCVTIQSDTVAPKLTKGTWNTPMRIKISESSKSCKTTKIRGLQSFKVLTQRAPESSGTTIQLGGAYSLGCIHTRDTSPKTRPSECVHIGHIIDWIRWQNMTFRVVKPRKS